MHTFLIVWIKFMIDASSFILIQTLFFPLAVKENSKRWCVSLGFLPIWLHFQTHIYTQTHTQPAYESYNGRDKLSPSVPACYRKFTAWALSQEIPIWAFLPIPACLSNLFSPCDHSPPATLLSSPCLHFYLLSFHPTPTTHISMTLRSCRCISSPPTNFPTLPPLPPLRLQPSPASCPHSPSRTVRQPC